MGLRICEMTKEDWLLKLRTWMNATSESENEIFSTDTTANKGWRWRMTTLQWISLCNKTHVLGDLKHACNTLHQLVPYTKVCWHLWPHFYKKLWSWWCLIKLRMFLPIDHPYLKVSSLHQCHQHFLLIITHNKQKNQGKESSFDCWWSSRVTSRHQEPNIDSYFRNFHISGRLYTQRCGS